MKYIEMYKSNFWKWSQVDFTWEGLGVVSLCRRTCRIFHTWRKVEKFILCLNSTTLWVRSPERSEDILSN